MTRELRIETAKQTLDILDKGYYFNEHRQQINVAKSLEQSLKGTILYKPDQYKGIEKEAEQLIKSNNFTTEIEITNESTIASVIRNIAYSKNLTCLNFASAKNPGGGFLNGSQAQEESLARATGLYPCINQMQEMYSHNKNLKTCLYSDYMIFSKQVPVIRDSDDRLLDQFLEVSIITAPAVNAGVVRQREPENTPLIEPVMRKRVCMILDIALINRIDTLVLGAWGCGVFQNDPAVIAKLFAEQINGKYRNAFKKIVFAILDNPKKSTIMHFEQAFAIKSKEL